MFDGGIGGKVKCSDGQRRRVRGWGGGFSAATAAASAAAADPLFAFPPLLQTGEIAETHNVLRRKIFCVRACARVFRLNAPPPNKKTQNVLDKWGGDKVGAD